MVRDGVDGLLVPVGRPVELGEALRDAGARSRAAAREMAEAARERAERFAWPRVAGEVLDVYEDALAAARAGAATAARRAPAPGLRPAEPGPRRAAAPAAVDRARGPRAPRRAGAPRRARRAAVGVGAVLGVGLTALALNRIGLDSIGDALLAATPVWVLVAFALMCASMLLRAEAWHAILRAALPGTRVRRRDTARGTMIGVLMSATLPARLGEPSRALIVARRLGRMRDRFPLVLGTLVSQTLLNILALVVLGAVMFATVGLFRGGEDALVIATIAPVVVLALRAGGALAAAPRQAVALPARAAGRRGGARRRWCRCAAGLQVFRRPRLGRLGGVDAAVRLGDPVARLLRAAGRARARRATPASAPPRRSCSPST